MVCKLSRVNEVLQQVLIHIQCITTSGTTASNINKAGGDGLINCKVSDPSVAVSMVTSRFPKIYRLEVDCSVEVMVRLSLANANCTNIYICISSVNFRRFYVVAAAKVTAPSLFEHPLSAPFRQS